MKLEKNVLLLICLLLITVMSTGCSDPKDEEKPQSITLSVDKNNFKSNGNEVVSFFVNSNEKDITNNSKTNIVFKEENTTLSGSTFSTNIPGTYTFYATFEGLSSADIQVNAMPVILILSADITSIKTNEKRAVTFSATADGENVTGNIKIFYMSGESEIPIEGNLFTTDQEGSYHFYCKYNDHISNIITISVVPFYLSLSANKTSIKANGTDVVSFTVTEDDNDITGEAIIYRKEGDDVIQLENNSFSTIMEGEYEFFAQYQKQTSNNISIEAIVSRLVLASDKTTALTGENITFSAISDDVKDVSDEMTLHIDCNGNKETLKGNIFTPSVFGSYSVYASIEDKTSNTIEIEVSPASVLISVDKDILKATGLDFAAFTVLADGKQINNADIFLKGGEEDIKISDNKFSSNIQGTFLFYAQIGRTKSELVEINVQFVNFVKQSCAIEAVATWCGFSPQMIHAFHEVQRLYSDIIQIVSIHRSTSYLGSTDINAEEFIEFFNSGATPFGIIDFDERLSRNAEAIRMSYTHMRYVHSVSSGIAIKSDIKDNSINVTLNVKVNETNEYKVCAIIVEDNVVEEQLVYLNNSHDDMMYDKNFVHHSVATYIMPNTNMLTGKSLGTVQKGSEVTESFSISLDKNVVKYRTVNPANCRVVAYILKKEGDKFYVNNATTCPVNGSVDYKYVE